MDVKREAIAATAPTLDTFICGREYKFIDAFKTHTHLRPQRQSVSSGP